jgi:hypothetical protein
MNSLDEQVNAVASMLRAAGGIVGIDPHAPDEIKRAWLRMMLECPECWGAMRGKNRGHDH